MISRLHPLALACLAVSTSSAFASPLELEETVITAKGYQAATQDIPQAIEVLQAQPSETAAPAGSLFRGQPGLAVHSDGAWGQNPVLRGLKKESVVVMVDGVRLNSAQPQGSLASFVDLGLLDRIEVVKGPGSVLYGSGALGGVVNLITPEANFTEQEQRGGRFGLSASSIDDGFSGAVLLRDSSTDHALVLGAAGRKVDDYESPSGTEERTGYSSDSLLLKYKQKVNDDISLKFNLQRHTDRDVWYPGSARTGTPARLGTVTMHSPEQRRELYQVGVENRLGEGTLSTDVYRQEVYREIRAYSENLGRNQVRNDVSFITHGLRSSYLVPVGNHLLTVGGEGWRMTGDPERHIHNNPPLFNNDQRNDPFKDGEVSSYGLFLQDEFDLGRTAIVAGARLDHVSGDAKQKGSGAAARTSGLSSSDNNLSWSLGATHPLTDTLNLYANIGQAYRAPDLRERFEDAARGDGYYHIGNPQLDAERSTSFEIGLKGHGNGFDYRLAAFHTRIDDYIAGRVTGTNAPNGLPIKRTENLDEVVIYGLEGSASKAVGAFVVDGGFTWLRGENKQDDEPLYQMPVHELTVGIGQPAERGFYWHTQLRAVAEQNRVATRFSNGTEDETSGFVTADASIGWGFGKVGVLQTANLDAKLSNLFDKAYHEHLADGVSGYELEAPGRGLTLALTGSF
ncbi:TonB-dependent receptor [Stutzerimonas stutzeri]|uniref:TonB-dependent receptor plug domain-containing protein n=1 Tax=Stutzerimonas sp. S1 TaxID=3030652 RepID=UPI002224120A|nr:TonB-dependent receptor [Stutzerimonas sp. S1]MCW3147647.1 TonB-dependent receptor [Stutzerimonas sp. S1]